MTITTYHGDCRSVLRDLPDRSIHAWITSPPYYGLRSYSDDPREIGREATPELFIAALVEAFREARRVLRDDGVCLVNLGDSYAQDSKWGGASGGKNYTSAAGDLPRDRRTTGYKDKDLMLLPFRVALALQADGWYVRSVMPWIKRNVMPESVTDRPTTAHEYIFLLSKQARYYWDGDAVRVTNSPDTHGGNAPNQHKRWTIGMASDQTTLGANHAGRNFRTSDPWLSSLDLAIDATRAELAHLEATKARGGLLADADADPLALLVNTAAYKGSHYAVFPQKLVEPLLLASVPRECCSACGAPRVRQTERKLALAADGKTCLKCGKNHGRPKIQTEYTEHRAGQLTVEQFCCVDSVTTGFRPSCNHDAPTAPGVVGDMFAGSGTVARVAIEHGRDALLIELSEAYIDEHISTRTDKVQVRLPL